MAKSNDKTEKDRETEKKMARMKSVLGPLGGAKGQQILEGAGIAAMELPTLDMPTASQEDHDDMIIDGVQAAETVVQTTEATNQINPKKRREDALALQKKLQIQHDAAVVGGFDKDVIAMLKDKLSKMTIPAEDLNLSDSAMMLSEALNLRASTQRLHRKQEEDASNRIKKAEENLAKARLQLEQEKKRQQEESQVREECMKKLNEACQKYQLKMDVEQNAKTPSTQLLAASYTTTPKVHIPPVLMENIPKPSPTDIASFLTNAPPDVGKYLSMCSEMLQTVMTAQMQQTSTPSTDANTSTLVLVPPNVASPAPVSQALKLAEADGQPASGSDGKRSSDVEETNPAKVIKTDA